MAARGVQLGRQTRRFPHVFSIQPLPAFFDLIVSLQSVLPAMIKSLPILHTLLFITCIVLPPATHGQQERPRGLDVVPSGGGTPPDRATPSPSPAPASSSETYGIAIITGNKGPARTTTSNKSLQDLAPLRAGLEALKFTVLSAENASASIMKDGLAELERRIREGQPAIFIFNGQAREKNGTAWLVPYGSNEENTAPESEWISVDEVAKIMTERKAFPAVIVVDAWWAKSHIHSAFTRDFSPQPPLPNAPQNVIFAAMPRAMGMNPGIAVAKSRQHSSFALSLAEAMEARRETGADAIALLREAAQSMQAEAGRYLQVGLSFNATLRSAVMGGNGPMGGNNVPAVPASGTVASVESSRTPQEATKEKPFINSLGMRFVPVKVVGDKGVEKTVLFSTWETRNKDLLQYYRHTGWGRMWETLQGDMTCPSGKITWQKARQFCDWLSKQENRRYRLPTDHEWSCAVGIGHLEKASASPKAKDAGVNAVPWAGGLENANGKGNFSSMARMDTFDTAAPVGSFPPNQVGLYDMAGNLWEWCEDAYDPANSGPEAPHVLRGASYENFGGMLLSSRRGSLPHSSYEAEDVGFRCVLEVDDRPITDSTRIPLSGGIQSALAIGQSSYPGHFALRNPKADADDTAAALQRWGFTTTVGHDLDSQALEATVRAYANTVKPGQVAMLFYAGHGVEIDGVNYLVPVDCQMASADEIRTKCLPAQKVIEILAKKQPALTCVILDCCRSGARGSGTVGASGRGLAAMTVPPRFVVAFSTAPGAVAEDGQGRNSPYTKQLLATLSTAANYEVELVDIFRETSRRLREQAGWQQPWVGLTGAAPCHLLCLSRTSPPVQRAK